ncbi:hypothetical protein [Amycolatopsis sp. FDAARGOS 1241]|uniref:hypothetical protein n=1 Tax=Amycolatopsis sp. FDAARGOS 1241 TaxID=2778070 RepID=UPI001EF19883|nr:hypothetical protein [Amycolatopsis sp. FDAARGOS 1241]
MIIELSAVVFFALLSGYAFADPASPLRDYVGALTDAWPALTAWGSPVVRHPFTLGIARTVPPQQVWHHPRFRRVNVVITVVWAASFTVSAAAGAFLLRPARHGRAGRDQGPRVRRAGHVHDPLQRAEPGAGAAGRRRRDLTRPPSAARPG